MKFVVEVTLRTPVIDEETADDAREHARHAFEIVCSKLQPNPPSVVEVEVFAVEETDG